MLRLCDIHIRDPFVLVHDGQYYMYGTRGADTWGPGTGFDVYVSRDLENWSEPREVFARTPDFWADLNYWAPEVHEYRGRFYMLASFKAEGRCRGTQILAADSPLGPFVPHSDGPVTPPDWECLDGTFYVDPQGVPYMVFCHEWLQVKDGQMCAVRLSQDLRRAEGEPVVLFCASQPEWADKGAENYVTDGPFLYTTASGKLLMLWSSYAQGQYVEAVALSESGRVTGPWTHQPQLLFQRDGGHGMVFRRLDGQLLFVLHAPNDTPNERPALICVEEQGDTLRRQAGPAD